GARGGGGGGGGGRVGPGGGEGAPPVRLPALVLPRDEAGVGAHLVGATEAGRVVEVDDDHLGGAGADTGDRQEQGHPAVPAGQRVEPRLDLACLGLEGAEAFQEQVQLAPPQLGVGGGR